MTTGQLKLRVKNRLGELERIAEPVEALARRLGLARRTTCQFQLVLEELFTNIVSHGFPDGAEHVIDITVTGDERAITLRIEDDGIAFNPARMPAPATDAAPEARCVGGLGIHMIRNFADSLHYERRRERNIVTIRKNRP